MTGQRRCQERYRRLNSQPWYTSIEKLDARENRRAVDSSLGLTVLRIWSSLLGLPPEQIDKNSPVQLFSDSVSILRSQDKLKKETGRTLTLEDIALHNTTGAQIRFLAEHRPLPTGVRDHESSWHQQRWHWSG
jgi:hypothetical protein